MIRQSGPFQWRNVPKMLLLVAGISSAVTLCGLIIPDFFGSQSITLPVLCIMTAVWWLAIFLLGKRPYPDEPPPAAQQETPEDRASREFSESQPTMQDYADAGRTLAKRRTDATGSEFAEILAQDEKEPYSSDHHYDRRI